MLQIIVILLKINFIIAFIGVSLAFWLEKPCIFLKKSTGSLYFISYLLFWPYFALNALALALFRIFSQENAIDYIIPDLYLGCQLGIIDYKRFIAQNIKSTLDLTCEFQEISFIRNKTKYLCIPLIDTKAPTLNQLDKAVSWIIAQLEEGPVFVHCALGHGRSATVVAAFLIKRGIVNNPKQAIEFIKTKRAKINLHPKQLNVLRQFAQSCISASNN